MTDKLTPYASMETSHNLSKVGKSKSPLSLAARMPTREIASKVGGSVDTLQAAGSRVVRLNRRP